jgi:hypothetical protein
MGSVWNCLEGLIYIYITVYYYYFSKDWIWTLLYAIFLNTLACFFLLWVPESPKYLYSQQRFKECYHVLKRMKEFNTGNGSSSVFTALVGGGADFYDNSGIQEIGLEASPLTSPA